MEESGHPPEESGKATDTRGTRLCQSSSTFTTASLGVQFAAPVGRLNLAE